MTFYKIITNSQLVGVGTTYDMRKFQAKHRIIITCAEDEAQYIQSNEILYADTWMAPAQTNIFEKIDASVIVIDESEYNILASAFDNNGNEPIDGYGEESGDEPVQEQIDENAIVTLELVQTATISEMSKECNRVIENGIDVALCDGNTYHFSLSIQDQLNLITLSSLVASGEEHIPYHADGELCRYYTALDIQAIVNAATLHKTFHVTYFNSLRSYIESLDSIDQITNVNYGMQIPLEYQSDILRDLYAQMWVIDE